jgi:hypothetical protein
MAPLRNTNLQLLLAVSVVINIAFTMFIRMNILSTSSTLAARTLECSQLVSSAAVLNGNSAKAPKMIASKPPNPSNYSKPSSYSILVPTHSGRATTLIEMASYYAKKDQYPRLDHIYIIWNDRGGKPVPPDILEDIESNPQLSSMTTVLYPDKPSLTQRFNLTHIPESQTAFASLDDDFRIPGEYLEAAFSLHQNSSSSLVGFYPRYARWRRGKIEYSWDPVGSGPFNLLLTGAAFISRATLNVFWSERFKRGRLMAEKLWNCEDLLMNAAAAQPPIYITPGREYQKRMPGAISGKRDHTNQRSQCLNSFREWFGNAWLRREGVRRKGNIIRRDRNIIRRDRNDNRGDDSNTTAGRSARPRPRPKDASADGRQRGGNKNS